MILPEDEVGPKIFEVVRSVGNRKRVSSECAKELFSYGGEIKALFWTLQDFWSSSVVMENRCLGGAGSVETWEAATV